MHLTISLQLPGPNLLCIISRSHDNHSPAHISMYSREETVNAVLKFYQQVLRHPYLDNNALIVPPPGGWDNITIQGKNETVVDLLRHLPYLRPEREIQRPIVNWETVPVCYAGKDTDEGIYPLPAHCIYLTHSVDQLGTALILDTDKGTLTEYTHSESFVTIPWDELDLLPEEEKWKGHYTAPISEFLDAWIVRYERLVWLLVPNPVGQPTTGRFYSRADSKPQEEGLLEQEGPLEPLHPQDHEDIAHDDESLLDREQRRERARSERHAAVGLEIPVLW